MKGRVSLLLIGIVAGKLVDLLGADLCLLGRSVVWYLVVEQGEVTVSLWMSLQGCVL
jgi:hypothetical protein